MILPIYYYAEQSNIPIVTENFKIFLLYVTATSY